MQDTIILGLKVVIVSWVLVAQYHDDFFQLPAEIAGETRCRGMRKLRHLLRHHAAPSQDVLSPAAGELRARGS